MTALAVSLADPPAFCSMAATERLQGPGELPIAASLSLSGKVAISARSRCIFFLMRFPEAGVPKVQKSGPLHQQPCTASLKMCI